MKKLFLIFALLCSTCLFSAETTLLLIRHGETDWNRDGRVQGVTNIPLNKLGTLQAKKLAEKIGTLKLPIKAIYSSDLDRAYDTAQETAKKLRLKIEKSPLLREINYGTAEGSHIAERIEKYGAEEKLLDEKYPNRHERWDHQSVPGAETFNQVLHRTTDKLTDIAKAHPNQTVAVFTHGRVINTFISELLDSKKVKHISNCCIAYFTYDTEKPDQPFKFVKIVDPFSD